jgi:hypothetical protein
MASKKNASAKDGVGTDANIDAGDVAVHASPADASAVIGFDGEPATYKKKKQKKKKSVITDAAKPRTAKVPGTSAKLKSAALAKAALARKRQHDAQRKEEQRVKDEAAAQHAEEDRLAKLEEEVRAFLPAAFLPAAFCACRCMCVCT